MSKSAIFSELVEFSKNWDSYVSHCYIGKEKYTVDGNHSTVKILRDRTIPAIYKIVDEKNFKIDYSVGQGNLAAIPWIAIMDRNVTHTTREKFYITLLFSRNAKRVYLSISLGATQFEEMYGKGKITIEKIAEAKKLWCKQFNNYAPYDESDAIDLLDEDDLTFRRSITTNIKWRADSYMAGSFFTKEYQLENDSLGEKFYIDIDLYLRSYKEMVNDPLCVPFFENLEEMVVDPIQQNLIDFNYDLPIFTPSNKSATNNKKNSKASSNGKKPSYSPVSKKVGEAGEEHVYLYERNKLINYGLSELAEKVYKQCDDKTTYPGYDIKSYDKNGNKIYIEVKSTKTKRKEYFEISRNELDAAKRLGENYYIYHVTNALRSPKITNVICDPCKFSKEGHVTVEPMMYKFIFASD